MSNKQTAVQKIIKRVKMYPSKEIRDYLLDQIIMEEESLALEKDQIKDAFDNGYSYDLFHGGGKQYYEKIYGNN